MGSRGTGREMGWEQTGGVSVKWEKPGVNMEVNWADKLQGPLS